MKVHVVKWGDGLAVCVPKAIAKKAQLQEGDALEVEVTDGCVELRRLPNVPSLAMLIAQITPENRYAEAASGDAVGQEALEW